MLEFRNFVIKLKDGSGFFYFFYFMDDRKLGKIYKVRKLISGRVRIWISIYVVLEYVVFFVIFLKNSFLYVFGKKK